MTIRSRSLEMAQELKDVIQEIESKSKSLGLDYFPIIFELVDYQEMSRIAAYGGFPTRYPHWRFGMEYEQLSKSYEYGLSLIYEMVINNNPCYAYLLNTNSMIDQKTVIAHVLGHGDFFKNNFSFRNTNRKMLDTTANHGFRIRRYIDEIGYDEVEQFLDKALSLENLIDQATPFYKKQEVDIRDISKEDNTASRDVPKLQSKKNYMDKYINPSDFIEEQRKMVENQKKEANRFPEQKTKDILSFLVEYAPVTAWQRDILAIIRDEAYYFAPQGQTKIMNEGWAVFWHSKLITEHFLKADEVIDYCDHFSSVLNSRPGQFNPYKIGLELFKRIKYRWDNGLYGAEYTYCDNMSERGQYTKKTGKGTEKIFEVRKIHNDITFIDEFFDEEFCHENQFFIWNEDRKTGHKVISSKEFGTIKKELLDSLTNFGQPLIELCDANYKNRGEMLLEHKHFGKDIRVDWAYETLKNIFSIWGRPVHLIAKIEKERKILSFNGTSPQIAPYKEKEDE